MGYSRNQQTGQTMKIICQLGFERALPLFCPFGSWKAAVGKWAVIFSSLFQGEGLGLRQVKMPKSQPFFLIKCSIGFYKPLVNY